MASLKIGAEQLETPTPDPVLTSKIVTYLKSQGVFDQFRRECMADVDTKPAYQNLRHRVEGSVKSFLQKNPWGPETNKNQLRDKLRKHIYSGGFLDMGVERILDQVVNPKIYSLFLPKVEEVVQLCLKLDANDKPMFVAPPRTQLPQQPLRFKDRHNLAPRAKVPAPLIGPRMPIIPNIEALKPPEPLDDKDSFSEDPGTPDLDESSDKNYSMDDNDGEDNADDDEDDDEEEESPPFEPHSEQDRLILGIRTDSSDNSSDNQVVTTVVDDDLEERIDKEDKRGNESNQVEEEDEEEEEESSSDEYVIPKTPTINMEDPDGTVIEFNSIREYRQYQTKFVEESFVSNVEEEVVCSEWAEDEEEERYSNEEEAESVGSDRKRKLQNNSYDETSSSSVDKGSTSDENTTVDVCRKKLKLEERHESTSDEEKPLEEYQHNGVTSDEEKRFKSNYFSDKRTKMEDYNESEMDKGNTSDEEKTFRSQYFSSTKLKLEEDGRGIKTEKNYSSDEGKLDQSNNFSPVKSEFDENDCLKEMDSSFLAVNPSNDDSNCSNPEQSFHTKSSPDINDFEEKRKSSSSSSKDSERSHRHFEHKESHSHHKRLKDNGEGHKGVSSVSRHSSKGKSYDRHESSRDRHKHRERKKSESSSSHSKSRHYDKPDDDNVLDENVLRLKHHKDEPSEHDKGRKKHASHNNSSEKKKDHDNSHGYEKEAKHYSKHGSSSDKHSRNSSSERHKSDKEYKHRESSDKDRKHNKKSDKQDSKKKHRDRCKKSKDNESRRSTDRDSNGPSGRGHTSSSSKLSSSKSNVETSVDSGERTSPNSDNVVSDSVEVLHGNISKFNSSNEQAMLSSDHQMVHSDCISSDQNESNDKQWSDSSFEMKDGKSSKGDKTSECGRESSDESDARRSVDETELVKFEGVRDDLVDDKNTLLIRQKSTYNGISTQAFPVSASSPLDNSSEKENIELKIDTTEPTHGNLSSEGNAKLKKPKIAANIFEVKKIMLARRKMKHMEKKRMKLLTKTTEQLPSNNCAEKSEEEFNGFGESLSDKTERYSVLIQRLSSEIDCDNAVSVKPGLMTSWMDISPDLDDYIENVLKGKVHRKIRVRLPPISDEHYQYDPELNVYILLDTSKELPLSTREERLDGNLNHLDTSYDSSTMEDSLNGRDLKPRYENCKLLNYCDSETLAKTGDMPNVKYQNLPLSSTSKQENEVKTCGVSALVSPQSINTKPDISKSKKLMNVSVTYNQYYKEILKEKNETPVVITKAPKTQQTVIKITNNRLSEQVVVQTVQPTFTQRNQLPIITKSVPKVNGQISKSAPKPYQMPLISRVSKPKCIKTSPSSTTKSSPENGNVSPDFTIELEGDTIMQMSPELINSMIGIQAGDVDQGNGKNTTPTLQEHQTGQRQTRESQQRYDSTDLYKPRPQLTSRRSRACHSLPTVSTVGSAADVTVAETRRKRTAVPNMIIISKRRR